MSLQSQFKSKVLLEKIEPLTVIKNEPEIGMDQDIINSDIKDEIDIEYQIIPEDLIKSEPIPNNLLESKHLESVETQIFVQTENTLFLKTEFENLVKTENTSDENLDVEEIQKRKAKLKIDELSHKTEKDNRHLKYHCDQCSYRTFYLGHFKRHRLTHIKPERIRYFYCFYCSYKCIRKSSLRVHIFIHFKYEEVPFHCYICDFVTKKRNFIVEHFKKHPEHRSMCDETEYKNQLETKRQKRYYTCKKCWFRTCHYEKFNLHELTPHLKYCCDKCFYKTFRYQDLKTHKVTHLKPEETSYFYCYHCSYKCKHKSNLKVHIFRHFKNEEVPFHCYICDFVTVKRDMIIKHFKKHPKYHNKCDETDYKISLKRYKGIHLKPEEISYFYCYHCSYKYKHKSTLKIHIFRHFKNEEVPFHCYICDFVTVKRNLIIKHFEKHPKYRSKCDETDYEISLNLVKESFRYSCKKCTFRTYQYEKFKLHELTHKEMDDRYLKYQCDKCTYKTFRSDSFKRHKLIHLKPEEIQYFYCYHCSYKSKQKSLLKVHIMRHFKNEVVQFDCYMCNFMTLKRNSITEHIKKHSKVQVKSNY